MIFTKAVLAVPLVIAVASGIAAVGIRWWAISIEKEATSN
jgi:hypothetical protein